MDARTDCRMDSCRKRVPPRLTFSERQNLTLTWSDTNGGLGRRQTGRIRQSMCISGHSNLRGHRLGLTRSRRRPSSLELKKRQLLVATAMAIAEHGKIKVRGSPGWLASISPNPVTSRVCNVFGVCGCRCMKPCLTRSQFPALQWTLGRKLAARRIRCFQAAR